MYQAQRPAFAKDRRNYSGTTATTMTEAQAREILAETEPAKHAWDLEDGYCMTHRRHCSMAADA